MRQTNPEKERGWLAVMLLLTCATLLPIWSLRFLPMQDYPQHLLQAHMLSTWNNPGVDYQDYFTLESISYPYASFYYGMIALSRFIPIETAGKLMVSMYIVLTALMVLRVRRRVFHSGEPWALLVVFPLIFNQQYFLGFVNFLLSLPILIIALDTHHEFLAQRLSLRSGAIPLLWAGLLFFTHPYSFLLYIGFSGLQSLLAWRGRPQLARGLGMTSVAAVVFAVWAFSSGKENEGRMIWNTLSDATTGALCMFTGMQWHEGVEFLPTAVWLLLVTVTAVALLKDQQFARTLHRRYLLLFGASVIGIYLLPHSKGMYTYMNLRLAPLAFFFLALAVGQVRLKGRLRAIFLSLLFCLLVLSILKQRQLSFEVAEVGEVVAAMEPGKKVLPLVFDNNSPELDRRLFDPHLHDHSYYHLLRGGGYSPYFWDAALTPVKVKEEVIRAASGPNAYYPERFSWKKHSASFDYFLLRGAPAQSVRDLRRHASHVMTSGSWLLFRKSSP